MEAGRLVAVEEPEAVDCRHLDIEVEGNQAGGLVLASRQEVELVHRVAYLDFDS